MASLIKLVPRGIVLAIFMCQAYAQSPAGDTYLKISMDIDEFIGRSYTPTFDCPPSELLKNINAYLADKNITQQQRFKLTSMKTHSLICGGRSTDAQAILNALLGEPNAVRSSKYYTSAIYQLGFVFDVQENPERCAYYQLAMGAAQDKFNDIHLSASLGYITECMKNQPNEQLVGIYKLLETVTKMDDKAALVHAFNRVGSLYGKRGQSKLSAAQYMKAYDASKDIYTNENKLPLLSNVIVAFMASNQLDEAKVALDDFITLNKDVNTAGSNFTEYFLASGYYMRVKDYNGLAINLQSWDTIAGNNKNPIHQGMYRWYSAVMCLQNNDLTCLRDFLENEKKSPASYQNYIAASKDYLYFIAKVNVALGNKEASLAAFKTYAAKMIYTQTMIEDSIESLNTAALHSKIDNLEGTLQAQQNIRDQIIYAFIGLFLVIIAGLALLAYRKSTKSKSFDSATGLLNNNAVINKLSHLAAPGAKRINAIAIFDIANFMQVNLTVGSARSDFVLQEIANTLKHIIRNSDILGRFGPEQFILCLADIEEDAAQAFFERTKKALNNTFSDYNNQQIISVDSSMSIYYSNDAFTDINEVLDNMLLSLSMKAKQVK